MRIIDAHAHIGYFGAFFDVGVTADELVSQMDEHGVQSAVISSLENDSVLEAVRRFPERLIPLVWVNPTEGNSAVDAANGYIEKGFRGIKLHPLVHAFRADEPVVDDTVEVARRRSVSVHIHSGHPPFSLPWSIGALAARNPDVDFVMIHMGHGHGVYIQAAIDVARDNPNIYLETSGMPMHTKIREAYRTVGADRVMFGTDAPFHHHSVEMQKVRVSGLDESELRRVFAENVAALMDL
ncbi:MAG: amidohydrolase family protein [Bacillota bacterium]